LFDDYESRHIGPQEKDVDAMLSDCGAKSMTDLMDQTIPHNLRRGREMNLPQALGESEALVSFQKIMDQNKIFRSHLGQGYYPTLTPSVILRCMFENPSWYTPYTPYQPEISQGRLEMLLNYQTMVCELTGMEISNASLLDEGLAAAEAGLMCYNIYKGKRRKFLISSDCWPQTISVCTTRLAPLGIDVAVVDDISANLDDSVCGVLAQHSSNSGMVSDFTDLCKQVHDVGGKIIVASDLLACTILKPPGEMGADIVVGSNQRFGVPMGFGGPHAGFLATKTEHQRKIPGRLIGVSKDKRGKKAYRLSLQTREQHIRRDKATSNICTAQALLANISAAYGIYHGPAGLSKIGTRVHQRALTFAQGCRDIGLEISNDSFFDTVCVKVPNSSDVCKVAESRDINVRILDDTSVCVSFDETTTEEHLCDLLDVFAQTTRSSFSNLPSTPASPLASHMRSDPCLKHPIFNTHHSETAMMRYLYMLEKRDLALNTAAIPLGSCTMKLNAATCMVPVTWPTVGNMHPFVPADQRHGYDQLIRESEEYLAEITGFHSISLQPNSGSQGEYAGVMCIAAYHRSRGEGHRNVCLIPSNAHGTNPASAAFAGMKIVVVKCDSQGNISIPDLKAKAEANAENLSCMMVTYPSTHGVFEEDIKTATDLVHSLGGQVYMDGANLQAQVGYCTPDSLGADVCHLNLHKTFCIPHGGGGPGLGPIGVREHLAKFLPNHPVVPMGGSEAFGTVSAAPWSSTSILPISYMYIRMMGPDGLKRATEVSILSANYMLTRLNPYYDVLYTGSQGRCAHEFIIDLRPFKQSGITEEDVAKRLMDYNLHAPTMSWPVAGTLMIEPTESEPKDELDRMCDALIKIRAEIQDVVDHKVAPADSPLRNAPHTADVVSGPVWVKPYTRHEAAYPLPSLKDNKFWPYVGRVDNIFGDKNLVCSCPSLEEYE
jgi:glycine dehydrogenase